MNSNAGWVVAAVVIIAAGVFYFWPSISTAPATNNGQATTTSQGTQQSARDISGNWRSNTDAKFTREIRTDGVIIDRYEGEPTAGLNGEWSVVANPATESGITVPAASLAGLTVIKVVWEGGVETTYFVVNELEVDSMTTTDLTGRGEVTVYSKVN